MLADTAWLTIALAIYFNISSAQQKAPLLLLFGRVC